MDRQNMMLDDEEEQQIPAKGKKAKAPKAPKPPKAQKAPKDKKAPRDKKSKGEKKPSGAGTGALIVFLVFVILLGGAYGAFYFNLMGFRDTVAVVLMAEEGRSPTQRQLDELYELTAQNEKELADLENQRNELKEIQESLDKRSEQVTRAEEQLAAREAQASEAPVSDGGSGGSGGADTQAAAPTPTPSADLGRIYGAMEPARAAQALSAMQDVGDIVAVLQAVKPAEAALILDNMEAALASQVTLAMMN